MNKIKFFGLVLCALPMTANAAIPYRVEQTKPTADDINRNESFAAEHRFYAGAGYNFSSWSDGADANVSITGDANSSFEAVVGVRVFDTFRIEANYYNLQADWDAFSLSGNTVFVNAIIDARIDSMYRAFRKQTLVPYVGIGGGVSWNSIDGAAMDNDVSPVVSAMVGLGIEMGERWALDLGYRYICMFSPDFDVIKDFAPTAHQLRAGLRFNF